MTTMDLPVDAIAERAAAMRPRVNWRRILIVVLTLIPWLAGKVVGVVVSGALYAIAAFQEGYASGRPVKAAQRRAQGA